MNKDPGDVRASPGRFNGAAGLNPRIVEGAGKTCVFRACFNGAAGLNPRIERDSVPRVKDICRLQWGRGCEPADSSGPWFSGGIGHGGFNGAAGVNPRIALIDAQLAKTTGMLQWGRGCEPADRFRATDG